MKQKFEKVSLVITVLNEEKTINYLLESISGLVMKPTEVLIVDGGSTDKTKEIIRSFSKTKKSLKFKLLEKKGNRSIGRNFAIYQAKNNWIAITDAGCILEKNWLKELFKKQQSSETEVVAGYYSVAKNSSSLNISSFQKAVAPYALVMPNNVDPDDFLPATRSVLISKKIWKEVGRFDESLSDNEDFEFAKRLQKSGVQMSFAKKAVVFWIPPSTLKSFYRMIIRFAKGDIVAGIIRPKVLVIFLRYIFGLLLFLLGFSTNNYWLIFGFIPAIFVMYIIWSIYKNYRHISSNYYLLPILQISSDLAVMHGSLLGFLSLMRGVI